VFYAVFCTQPNLYYICLSSFYYKGLFAFCGFNLQFSQPDLPGYVGFANLPNQVHRKSVKKGFEFTLMVVGEFVHCFSCVHNYELFLKVFWWYEVNWINLCVSFTIIRYTHPFNDPFSGTVQVPER